MTDKEQNPWTILSEKEIYNNAWIDVTEFQVLNPSGGKGIYGKVHFKNRAVGVIPIDKQGNTWLVGQYRFTLSAYSWEIPEGGGAMDEDPLLAAKRELTEETGLIAHEWTKLMNIHLSNSVSDEFGTIYLAQNLEQGKASPEETEQLIVKKLPFSEVAAMVENGDITDSLSVAAVQRIQLMIYQGKIKIAD